MKTMRIIGVMSGTSLDGVDVACVDFEQTEAGEQFKLIHSKTYPYSAELFDQLHEVFSLSANNIYKLDKDLGDFFAEKINEFIKEFKIDKKSVQAIASHGHTIFHQPQNGYTVQIACGTTIAVKTGIDVINDFRTKDVILHGNGAPLVPIGDFDLFKNDAESFLNIGGFSNISLKVNGKTIAYDICPGNLPLNKLVKYYDKKYDSNGDLAKSGDINFFLLDLLNTLPYYEQEPPKSLGIEWLESEFYPLIKFDKEIENNLSTVVEHITYQISIQLKKNNLKSVMITGGGAKNSYLIERIKHYYKGEIIIPKDEIIEFKEAIIFAYLGYLYLNNKVNCLSSVTGAKIDSCGGVLHKHS